MSTTDPNTDDIAHTFSLTAFTGLAALTVAEANSLSVFPPNITTLALERCRMATLPDPLPLQLATLKLETCKKLTALPQGLSRCTQLARLDLSLTEELRHCPDLSNLRSTLRRSNGTNSAKIIWGYYDGSEAGSRK